MVQMYSIAGRQIGSHWLAIATLTILGGTSASFMGGSKAKAASQGPPINASSSDEESFIKDFLKQSEEDGKKADAAKK